jgi:hypothetical protein
LQSYRGSGSQTARFPAHAICHWRVASCSELSASVFAIIRRCLQTGRHAHALPVGSPNLSPARAFCEAGFQNSSGQAAGGRNALRSWPAGKVVRKEGFCEQRV